MGAIVNFLSIIAGGIIGLLLKKGIPERISETIVRGVGLCVLLIGIDGVLEGKNALITIISIVIGAMVGELINIDAAINRLAKYTENAINKRGRNVKFANGFVSATLLFAVGAMTIVGSLDSGLTGDNSTLYTKSLLDGISSIVFASSLGIGVLFSSIPILIIQGGITLLAHYIAPLLTDTIIGEMTCVGSLLIIALALNLLDITKLKVANYLPAIFVPIILCQFM